MRRRSLFGPFVLIATGLVWLLIELGNIPVGNLWALTYIWPYLLMAVGVGLVLGSRWPITRMFVSGLVVLGLVLAIVFAPQLSWNQAPAWGSFTWSDTGGSIRGSGAVVTETRQVSNFDSLEVDFPAELTIQQGSSTSLTVEAEDNLMPQLATRVSGHTLYIENSQPDWTKRVNATRPVRIHMTVRDLKRVELPSAGTVHIEALEIDRLEISISGAGTVNVSDLSAQDLSIHLSGAGNITASGSVDNLSMDISGFGGFQGGDLASQAADITISGAGSATVWAVDSLSVGISGTGSVNYYGSPRVNQQISGLGSVSRSGDK
jgi:hypothetical protein